MYYVYILRSQRTGMYYTGYSINVEQRLRDHTRGHTKSLKKHLPLEIIRTEEYSTKLEAMRREKQIKSYKSGDAFRKLISK